MAIEKSVLVPDIGDFDGVEVIEILVSAGDSIAVEDSLVTLESDKASIEIPSPYAGVVREVAVKIGDKVSEGTLLLHMLVGDSAGDKKAVVERSGQLIPDVPTVPDVEEKSDSDTPAPGSGDSVEQIVLVPDIGSFEGVEVIEILVAEGDSVAAEDSLVTLESDKASIEIPSPLSGEVAGIVVKVGDRVSKGDPLLKLKTQAELQSAKPAQAHPDEAPAAANSPARVAGSDSGRQAGEKESRQPPVLARPSDLTGRIPHASPSVRRFARELGADLAQIIGTGPKQRITRDDIQNYIKLALRGVVPDAPSAGPMQLPALPEIDFAKFGEIEERPLSRIKKLSGGHLSACWLNIPHVTQHDEADITSLEAFRNEQKSAAARQDIRLTFLPFLMKACVGVLRELPEFNSSLSADRGSLIYKKYFNIGVAVDTPGGLVVPVVRNVDKKGVLELAAELMAISQRARDGKLSPSDLQGGCFSISSLGGIGGTAFTPIVNAPEVAILGVSKSAFKPVWNGKEFEPRLMLPLSLSYDHRVIDGAMAARFTSTLSGLMSDIRRLLL
ncbi:MAG: dihydrolipoyllysine-residue acetyltransferase [Gammaproteobacteria bacterium]|nr:dihydrolipoyllysine-residue acetyltransferase [Gammaproteobacteria bacterium]